MFVPPYDVLLGAIGTSRELLASQQEVTISVKFLELLLQSVVAHSEFNEKGYLAANPDVAAALNKKSIASAKAHYVSYGYLECRRGATPEVDEAWYTKTNPDVLPAIRRKTFSSVAEHYRRIGIGEFRAPREVDKEDCSKWKSAAWRTPEP